jgi:hypothetical protein
VDLDREVDGMILDVGYWMLEEMILDAGSWIVGFRIVRWRG